MAQPDKPTESAPPAIPPIRRGRHWLRWMVLLFLVGIGVTLWAARNHLERRSWEKFQQEVEAKGGSIDELPRTNPRVCELAAGLVPGVAAKPVSVGEDDRGRPIA